MTDTNSNVQTAPVADDAKVAEAPKAEAAPATTEAKVEEKKV